MKIKEAIEKKVFGLHFNSRAILPFQAHFLKIIFNDDIYTDFSLHSPDIVISEEGTFTNIYFRNFQNIDDEISRYESIKVVAVEKDTDLFNISNHLKLVLIPEDNHKLRIDFADDDTIFIE